MRRSEPPPLATWLLEHCVPADHSDELAGDLLEDFRAGRSDSWYWQQTLSACAVSWGEGLRARMTLLLFALLWCMLAPAWKAVIDGIDSAPGLDRIMPYLGPFWIFAALAGWVILHSIFLWAGILVYYIANKSLGRIFRRGKLSRALLLAPLVFAPMYGATFVWSNLYWYSFFANAKLAPTPLSQMADLQILANVMRVPFFIALISALWNLVPQSPRAFQTLLAGSHTHDSSTHSSSSTLAPLSLFRFLAIMAGAGLINAMIAAFVLCRLPASHAPSVQSLLIRAGAHVAIGAMAGIIGTYIYWFSPLNSFRNDPPLPFSLFALVCATGWVWVPSMAMFYEQMSGMAALPAAIGAFFLAVGLRQTTFSVLAPTQKIAPAVVPKEFELFAESLNRPRGELYGYFIAVSLFAAAGALAMQQNLAAAALLASSAALFAWKRTFVSSVKSTNEYRRSAVRLALIAVPAVLVTAWALLDGVAHRNLTKVGGIPPLDHSQAAMIDASKRAQQQTSSTGAGGYESLILWPYPEKKPVVAPIPAQSSFLAPGTTQPLIIRFDGPYWYLQPPDKRPGPTAHEAHGTPLSAGIRSINDFPLVMDAHQTLGASIPIARCREIDVEIENHDNHPGSVAMAVLLSDGSAPGKPELYLGQQPIPAAEAGPGSIDSALPGELAHSMSAEGSMQTLHFAIPAAAKIRQFNEITVMMLPDTPHSHDAPKIAVREFQLMPR
jgi:hypothetical protein